MVITIGHPEAGLGTALIGALAEQLEARITEVSTALGRTVEVAHASFVSKMPRSA